MLNLENYEEKAQQNSSEQLVNMDPVSKIHPLPYLITDLT